MKHVFWLIPDRLAGRPGPDREPWDLASMRDAGIGAILSVNDGLSCHPEAANDDHADGRVADLALVELWSQFGESTDG